MNVYLYIFLAFAYLVLFNRMRSQIRGASQPRAGRLFLLTLCAALAYNAFILATGSWIRAGDLLKALSIPRYLFHLVFVPLLLITLFDFGAEANVSWARSVPLRIVAWLFTAFLLAYGMITNYLWAVFVPGTDNEILSYVVSEPSPEFPLIAATGAALVFGLVLLLRTRWPWLIIVPGPYFGGTLRDCRRVFRLTAGHIHARVYMDSCVHRPPDGSFQL